MPDQPPRCVHGHIILGCPHGDCPTQGAYLDQHEAALAEFERQQQENVRAITRAFLGDAWAAVLWPDHDPSCPWRRAVEWVRDTDQGTT